MKRKMQKIMVLVISVVLMVGYFPVCNYTVNAETLSEIPEGYTPIYTFEDLYNIRANTSGNYILMNDIDLSETAEGGKYDCGTGWASIPGFEGTFDGNGYSIKNLNNYGIRGGLFSFISSSGNIKNLNMDNVQILDGGGGIASSNHGTISNCSVSGSIVGDNHIGGIVGSNTGTISCCSVSGMVIGNDYVGGICGLHYYGDNKVISECYNSAIVKGNDYVGGIAGKCNLAYINDSYNIGNVEGNTYRGGIAGSLDSANAQSASELVNRCYSRTVSSVIGINHAGNFSVRNSYYISDSNTSSNKGNSLTDWQMKLQSSYEGFDFENVWTFTEGSEYPQLISNPEGIVKNISLYSVPTKIKYYQGEELNVDGAKIKVTYSNKNYTSTIPITLNMVTGIDTSVVGEQTATVTYKGFAVEFPITVLPILAESIELTTNTLSVDVGNTYILNAAITPENTTDKTITWTTSDEIIATVEDGVVKGIKPGTVKIAATTNNKTAVCTVTVLQPASSIAINATEMSIDKGKTSTITTTLTPSDSTDEVTYSSNNKSVCTVDENGVVTAVAVGEAVITVSTNRGLSKFCTVTVTQPSESITLNKDNAEIVVNNSFVLSATMLPNDTTDIVNWTSSNDSICTVNENGVVTGISKGSAVITATSTSGKTATCTVIVKSHAGGHTVVIDKAVSPTCTETGLTEGAHCSECNEVIIEQQIVPATGHTVVIDEAITPTCTEIGLTEGSHCAICGKIIVAQEEIPATGHHVVIDEAITPTCTEIGVTEGSHCETCGGIIVKQEEISATGHSYGEWTVSKLPTCIAEGKLIRECSICGEKESKDIEKIGHLYIDSIIEPTCIEHGCTLHKCSVCGNSYNDTYTEATGHSYGEWTVSKPATCTEEGEQIKECSICGKTETKEIEKIAHKYVETLVDPTCTEQGYRIHKCSVCGYSYNDTYTEATGHSYGEWTVSKPATCTEEGEQIRECSNCGKTETKEIEKIAHKYVETIVEPTCTEQGYTIHKCSVCGYSYNDTYTEATGHSYGEWTVSKPATSTEEGEQIRECTICGEKKLRIIEKLEVVTSENEPITSKEDNKETQSNVIVTLSKVKFTLTAGKKKVSVRWSKVKDASGYMIYYKTSKKGSWKKLKNVSAKKTSFVKKKLMSKKTYYFTVKAYKKVNGKKVYGKFTTKKIKVK